jgi:hypothetical protein
LLGDGSSTDKVIITHTKGGRSASDLGFEFVWELAVQFDRNMRNLEGISLTIPEISYSSDFPKDKKKEIQKLIARWQGHPRREHAATTRNNRGSRASLDPSAAPRIETEGEKSENVVVVRVTFVGAVKEMLGVNAALQYMQWGTVTTYKNTKERLFVLSNYRVLLLNKTKMLGPKKKVYEGYIGC